MPDMRPAGVQTYSVRPVLRDESQGLSEGVAQEEGQLPQVQDLEGQE